MPPIRRCAATLVASLALATPVVAAEVTAVCPRFRDDATRAILDGPRSQWPKALEWASADLQRATLQLRIGAAESDIGMLEAARPVFESRSNLFNGVPPFAGLLSALAVINNDAALLARAEAIYKKAVRVDWGGAHAAGSLAILLALGADAVDLAQARTFWNQAEQIIRKEAKRAGGQESLDSDWQALANNIAYRRSLREHDAAAVDIAIARHRTLLKAETNPIKRVQMARELAYYLVSSANVFTATGRVADLTEASTLLEGASPGSGGVGGSLAFAQKLKPSGEDLAGAWTVDRNDCAKSAHDEALRAWAAVLLADSDETRAEAARRDLARADSRLAQQPTHLLPPRYPLVMAASLIDSAGRAAGAERNARLAEDGRALDEAGKRAAHCFCAEDRADILKQRERLAKASTG